ncbi:uncharacterized protein METZ01_LOCUS241283 [marine metagenome]|uniref:Uncharacterized protein n=1 Tax=marine metagenome TaxID=408172 RepID=A0A382HMK3_9ZZZZ
MALPLEYAVYYTEIIWMTRILVLPLYQGSGKMDIHWRRQKQL